MRFLLDTNILSELRKGQRADPQVVRWADAIDAVEFGTSVLVIGEMRRGIELARRRDQLQAARLEQYLERTRARFDGRILPVTEPIAQLWGRLGVPDRLPQADGILAATAIVHDLVLVTRNVRDVARSGAKLLNPFVSPA
ncbi:type II toxin-antitoxin system VapC family toxin [Salinarimonas rosea]|uniref:type II toxin-antitoxin system VapC family toxin n=1 Tax=Salinarimonas rosea TaxID=552063 RepID=UPI000407DA0C|nr:type II toxin-antitoxin system VapC family toxin [Salinarimonas rosea]